MVRTIFTYLIALLVIAGGGALVIIPTQLEADTLLPFLTGAVGTVLGYVFGERASSSAVSNQPTVTTTTGPPPSVTIRNIPDDPYEQERMA